jgi:hypothetical protein
MYGPAVLVSYQTVFTTLQTQQINFLICLNIYMKNRKGLLSFSCPENYVWDRVINNTWRFFYCLVQHDGSTA